MFISPNQRGSPMRNTLFGTAVTLVLVLQLLSAHALAPVHDHTHNVLAPIAAAPTPASSSRIVSSTLNQPKAHTGGLITTHETSQLSTQAGSYWVKQLTFNYGPAEINADFHTGNPVAEYIYAKRGDMTTNFVVATLGAVHKGTYSNLDFPASGTCFNSGGGNVAFEDAKCLGGYDAAGSKEDFIAFLKMQTGSDADPSAQLYYHSEQALLSYLYLDSLRCVKDGLAKCKFGEVLTSNGVNPCMVEVLVLDLISVPNSVCSKCDPGLEQALFAKGYRDAMTTHCGAPIAPRVVVRTSSYVLFRSFKHISAELATEDAKKISEVIASSAVTVVHSEPKA